MLSIELLKNRGVCLWAYARSQTALESMIHEAERLIDRLELIKRKGGDELKLGREKVVQWDWEVRSQLSLLFRPAQPVLEAFQGFPLRTSGIRVCVSIYKPFLMVSRYDWNI
jgi:hypothetical protein